MLLIWYFRYLSIFSWRIQTLTPFWTKLIGKNSKMLWRHFGKGLLGIAAWCPQKLLLTIYGNMQFSCSKDIELEPGDHLEALSNVLISVKVRLCLWHTRTSLYNTMRLFDILVFETFFKKDCLDCVCCE